MGKHKIHIETVNGRFLDFKAIASEMGPEFLEIKLSDRTYVNVARKEIMVVFVTELEDAQ